MSIDHGCVEQEVEDPEPLSLRSPAYTVATCLLIKAIHSTHACSFFDFCFARSGSPMICTHCSSGIYFLCCEVFHQARRWEEVVKCHMHCFELELLTKPFHHTSTKPDFNLIVVLFPNIYISNWNTYPADESARTHPCLVSTFVGLHWHILF